MQDDRSPIGRRAAVAAADRPSLRGGRVHTSAGDIAISEEPTYYLAHTMFRDRGLVLKGVALEEDGISIAAVEKVSRTCARATAASPNTSSLLSSHASQV